MYNPGNTDTEAPLLQGTLPAEQVFKMAMMYSTGRSMPLDMCLRMSSLTFLPYSGIKDAVRLRNEIDAEMSDHEIATAQRAARHWLTRH
jgi:hypothetical protein